MLAKEKGFEEMSKQVYNHSKEVINSYYSTAINCDLDLGDACTVTTQSILQKWLREKHALDTQVYKVGKLYATILCKTLHEKYEDALEEHLVECLEQIKL